MDARIRDGDSRIPWRRFAHSAAAIRAFRNDNERPPRIGGCVKSKNAATDFRGEKRTNDTHASTTDPDARLYKQSAGSASKLGYLGHVMTENRNGLVVDTALTLATGTAEREAALEMVGGLPAGSRITLGADKGYDAAEFVKELRLMDVTPHIAQNNTNRRSAIDGRSTGHAGYEVSQRKRVEKVFGWGKVVGTIRKARVRGLARVRAMFTFAMAAYNLVRITKLEEAAARSRDSCAQKCRKSRENGPI